VISLDKDRTFIGDPHPKLTGGLNIDLGYGNFDLNMFFYGSYGNDMINYASYQLIHYDKVQPTRS
jgi:hypothetical protein